mgnify:CR=1 FL=1
MHRARACRFMRAQARSVSATRRSFAPDFTRSARSVDLTGVALAASAEVLAFEGPDALGSVALGSGARAGSAACASIACGGGAGRSATATVRADWARAGACAFCGAGVASQTIAPMISRPHSPKAGVSKPDVRPLEARSRMIDLTRSAPVVLLASGKMRRHRRCLPCPAKHPGSSARDQQVVQRSARSSVRRFRRLIGHHEHRDAWSCEDPSCRPIGQTIALPTQGFALCSMKRGWRAMSCLFFRHHRWGA